MFFPERIKNIKPTDNVLEIGPGASPHLRSNILLEKQFENEAEYEAQYGSAQKLTTEKKVVFYDGNEFPFRSQEFDYVICSHVLEHVENIELFLCEMFRVAPKGYIEYPLAYYEYLYNFDVHLNLLKFNGDKLFYMKKSDTELNYFKPIQKFFYDSLNRGHSKLIDDLVYLIMEGFEWDHPFDCIKVTRLEEVLHDSYEITSPSIFQSNLHQVRGASLLKKIKHKFIS